MTDEKTTDADADPDPEPMTEEEVERARRLAWVEEQLAGSRLRGPELADKRRSLEIRAGLRSG